MLINHDEYRKKPNHIIYTLVQIYTINKSLIRTYHR